jgi:hypothetical protein
MMVMVGRRPLGRLRALSPGEWWWLWGVGRWGACAPSAPVVCDEAKPGAAMGRRETGRYASAVVR